jgi:hypothetical protein
MNPSINPLGNTRAASYSRSVGSSKQPAFGATSSFSLGDLFSSGHHKKEVDTAPKKPSLWTYAKATLVYPLLILKGCLFSLTGWGAIPGIPLAIFAGGKLKDNLDALFKWHFRKPPKEAPSSDS